MWVHGLLARKQPLFGAQEPRYQRFATARYGWVAGAEKCKAEKRFLMGFYRGTPYPWT